VDGLRIGRSLRDASYEGATLTCQSDISYQRSKRDGGRGTLIFCLPDTVTARPCVGFLELRQRCDFLLWNPVQ
jgi:hypothetical protein